MVQVDDPLTNRLMISEAVQPMINDSSFNVVNLVADINSQEEFEDRNCLKVVLDKENNAMYFSREPIPTQRLSKKVPMKKQVCIIPFRREFLFAYQNMAPTSLEIIESVDMMRILENGYKVKMIHTSFNTSAVDTKEDLEKVQFVMKDE